MWGSNEVFTVLHWFRPESAGIRSIPGIPEESNLAEWPAKLTKQFRRNVERNSHSAGIVPGITRTESMRNDQERNPNRTSAFADVWFGCHQPINSLFPYHHYHQQRRPHCPLFAPPTRLLVITTNGRHRPHTSPNTTTATTMWQRHVTDSTSRGPTTTGTPGATSPSATWQPDDERRRNRRSSSSFLLA